MASKQSNRAAARDSVPDPRQESIAPEFEVSLVRELRSLLTDRLEGPHDRSVALGARSLADIFARTVPAHTIPVEAARSVGRLEVGGCIAWPIFITYAGGHRDPYAAVYNHKQIEQSLRAFYTTGASTIRGGIGEAIRNVGQHGHDWRAVGFGQSCFGPAALFVREFAIPAEGRPPHRILMAMVADEGPGIANPERSILNGVSGLGGDASLGMGVEMNAALLYLVKSRKGEWCLFDGARQVNPDKYTSKNDFNCRVIGDDEKIERLATLDLPAPPKGCQKIMFFPHPSATADDKRMMHGRLLAALEAIQR